MAHLRLNISGMTGPPCQRKVERVLTALPGMYAAVVCLERGHADVEYGEDRLTAEDIIQVIGEAGYGAKLGG